MIDDAAETLSHVRQTSIDAYHQIRDEGLLSQRRLEVYCALFDHGPCTANELFRAMSRGRTSGPGILNSNVVTRLGELRELGIVEELGTRSCAVTGHTVIVWDVNDKLPLGKIGKKKTRLEDVKAQLEEARGLLYKAAERSRQRLSGGLTDLIEEAHWLDDAQVFLSGYDDESF